MAAHYKTIKGHRRAVEQESRVYLNGSRHDAVGRAFCHIAPETDDEEVTTRAPWDVLPLDLMMRSTHQPSRRR